MQFFFIAFMLWLLGIYSLLIWGKFWVRLREYPFKNICEKLFLEFIHHNKNLIVNELYVPVLDKIYFTEFLKLIINYWSMSGKLHCFFVLFGMH